jgi:hypothetical protein
MEDLVGEAAVHGRGGPELHARVHVVVALLDGAGARIRDARLHHDAVADGQVRDALADLEHGAGALVTEDHRRLDDERADLPVGPVVHVGGADADGVHRDAHLAGAGGAGRLDLLDRHPILLVQHQRAHLSPLPRCVAGLMIAEEQWGRRGGPTTEKAPPARPPAHSALRSALTSRLSALPVRTVCSAGPLSPHVPSEHSADRCMSPYFHVHDVHHVLGRSAQHPFSPLRTRPGVTPAQRTSRTSARSRPSSRKRAPSGAKPLRA